MKQGAKILVFWGAGATATIGMRTTAEQAKSLASLASNDLLSNRINIVLKNATIWQKTFTDLLLILGDDLTDHQNVFHISDHAQKAMQRHWNSSSQTSLDERIHELRSLYDWATLKQVIRLCPAYDEQQPQNFQLTDTFNVLDMHIQSAHGFNINGIFFDKGRLTSARRALMLILNTLFYIDWQVAITDKKADIDQHYQFAKWLTRHHQQQGIALANDDISFDNREFYFGDIAFCSLNYDPILMWMQFIANKEANDHNPPYIGAPANPLKIFHDFGIFMAVSDIDAQDKQANQNHVWYPMNESAVQRINDEKYHGRRVKINKMLYPHGNLGWRECPNCGKLSAYFGQKWDIYSAQLFTPPPLNGFVQQSSLQGSESEEKAWKEGKVDARACVHCNTLTFAEHIQAIMQSNFKTQPPPFIEEVQRDLRIATQSANHIILMGYSLPADDVTYRAFLSARKKNNTSGSQEDRPVKCSVVVGHQFGNTWYDHAGVDDLIKYHPDLQDKTQSPRNTIESARAIFGKENVRFYGGGIPQVFNDPERLFTF